MISRLINHHWFSCLLLVSGIVAMWQTGDVWFLVVGAGAFLVGLFLRKIRRTLLWACLAIYAALAVPNGWFLVVVLAAIVACFPMFRGFTPIGDFMKPKKTA